MTRAKGSCVSHKDRQTCVKSGVRKPQWWRSCSKEGSHEYERSLDAMTDRKNELLPTLQYELLSCRNIEDPIVALICYDRPSLYEYCVAGRCLAKMIEDTAHRS